MVRRTRLHAVEFIKLLQHGSNAVAAAQPADSISSEARHQEDDFRCRFDDLWVYGDTLGRSLILPLHPSVNEDRGKRQAPDAENECRLFGAHRKTRWLFASAANFSLRTRFVTTS
jgi:hypothetical protein